MLENEDVKEVNNEVTAVSRDNKSKLLSNKKNTRFLGIFKYKIQFKNTWDGVGDKRMSIYSLI